MKKFVKMATSGKILTEVNADIDFVFNFRLNNVKIGKGGGGRIFV
jgi:hypothetical protein